MLIEKFEKAHGKRVLSALLAILMIVSTASVCMVSVSARHANNLVAEQGEEEAFEESAFEPSTTKYITSATTAKPTDSTTNAAKTTTTSNTTGHEHRWISANCVFPKRCSLCGLTEGAALGHNYDPDGYCTRCGQSIHGNESTTNMAEEDGFVWSPIYLDGDYFKEVKIDGYRGEVPGKLVIPEKIDGAIVTELDLSEYSFYASDVEEIHIPSTVTQIYTIYRPFIGNTSYYSNLKDIVVDEENTAYISRNGVLFDANEYDHSLIMYPPAKSEKTYTIPTDVRTIRAAALAFANNLEEVHLPDGLDLISSFAFWGSAHLKELKIPKSVRYIDSACFYGCAALTEIQVQTGNPGFMSDDGVLYNQSGQTLLCYPCGHPGDQFVIPDHVISVGSYAFSGCQAIKNIVFSDGTTYIADHAFSGCVNLASIRLVDHMEIDRSAFEDTALYANESNWVDGVLYCDSYALDCRNDKRLSSELVIPEGTRGLTEGLFYNNEYLKSVAVPHSIKSIGDSTFAQCSKLTTVELADGLEKIGYSAFRNCAALQTIELPNSLIAIGYSAFEGCKSIRKIVIPSSLQSISGSAFRDCTGLVNLDIQEGTTCIEGMAFWSCTSLVQVSLPNTLEEIGYGAFAYCTSLRSVQIPNSVLSVGSEAFEGCRSLENISFPNNLTEIGYRILQDTAFEKNAENFTDGILYAGEWAIAHSESVPENLILRSGTKVIADYLFSDCDTIESVTIPGSVENWGNGTFEYCDNLKKVVIEKGVTEIPNYTFLGCEKLNHVTIPNTVSVIGSSAFSYTGIQEIMIPSGVTRLGYFTFSNSDLTRISLPDTLTYIGRWCFDNTPLFDDQKNWDNGVLYVDNHLIRADAERVIGSYTVRNKTRCIACEAFSRCKELTKVKIPNTVRGIGEYAFYGCQKLQDVQIPNSVVEIDHGAFEACSTMESVSLSDRIEAIHSLFKDCSSLKRIEVPRSVTMLAYVSFAGCSSLESITLPTSLKEINKCAFAGCTSLGKVFFKGDESQWRGVSIDKEEGMFYSVNDYYESGNDNNCLLNAEVVYPMTMQQGGVIVEYFAEDLPNTKMVVERQEPDADDETTFQVDSGTAVMKYQIHFVDADEQQIVQPSNHTVTVRIPIDRAMAKKYPPSQFVYRVFHAIENDFQNNESFSTDGKGVSKKVRIEGDERNGYYLVFDVHSFSPFLVCVEKISPTVAIRNNPGTTTLRYGETLVLTADAENLPDGAKLVWKADSDCVMLKPSADGKTCEVTSKKNGTVTVTVKAVDTDGKAVESEGKQISDSETVRSKAGFIYKLIAFFKRLFGVVVHTTQTVVE